jgi:hypothetical protein
VKRRWLVLVGAMACCAGCATVKSGSFDINQDWAEQDFPKIKRLAAFELGCRDGELTLVTLDALEDVTGTRATQVGVEGCGRRAVYVRRAGGDWVQSSSSK